MSPVADDSSRPALRARADAAAPVRSGCGWRPSPAWPPVAAVLVPAPRSPHPGHRRPSAPATCSAAAPAAAPTRRPPCSSPPGCRGCSPACSSACARRGRRGAAVGRPQPPRLAGHARGQRRRLPRGGRRRRRSASPLPVLLDRRPRASLGGLAAAGLVLALSARRRGAGPTRLVLAGSAIALALCSLTTLLLLLLSAGDHRALRLGQRHARARPAWSR